MEEVLNYLKKQGQRMDFEIAKDINMSLEKVRLHAAELSAAQKIIICKMIQFDKGKEIEGWQCRFSGYIPPAAPGRKAKGSAPQAA